MISFTKLGLSEPIAEQVRGINYLRPTPVQKKVIPQLLNKRNLIVEAATGTGKTAAYALPILDRIDLAKKTTQALILVPSRELAEQVEGAFIMCNPFDTFRIAALYGGKPIEEDVRVIRSQPHVVVAVPGRLRDVLFSSGYDLFWKDIRFLIIDEADKLLSQGFFSDYEKIANNVRSTAQVAMFSATIPQELTDIMRGEKFGRFSTIRLSAREAVKNISFHFVDTQGGNKEQFLLGTLKQEQILNGLIFCNSREEVVSVSNFLRAAGEAAEAYHGLQDQVQRDAIIRRFKSGGISWLVATDLAARGLDIADLQAVINFSLPKDTDTYIHRCGRTGRAGASGRAYNIIAGNLEFNYMSVFHEELEKEIVEVEVEPKKVKDSEASTWVKAWLSRGKKDKMRPGDIVGFLVNVAGVEAGEIGTITIYENYSLVDVPASVSAYFDQPGLKIKGKSIKMNRFTQEDQEKKAGRVKKRVEESKKRNRRKD